MIAWWDSLSLFQQIMVAIAAPCSFFVIIQLVLILFGFSSDDSLDVSPDDVSDMSLDYLNDEGFINLGGLKILSVRGVIAFLSVGGWVAMAFAYTMPELWAGLLGIVAGSAIALIIALIMHYAQRLQSSGNLNYANAVGKTGTVYMRVPPKKSGRGKISITIQERYVEIEALSNEEEYIPTGTLVKVVAVEGDSTVIVERV